MVALQHFGVTEAQVGTFKAERRDDMDGFKRDLLQTFMYMGHSRKVIRYVVLLGNYTFVLNPNDNENSPEDYNVGNFSDLFYAEQK